MIHKISRRVIRQASTLVLTLAASVASAQDYVPYSQRGGDYKDDNIQPYSTKDREDSTPFRETTDADYKINYGRRTYIPDVNHSPTAYNNFIVDEQMKIIKKQIRYIKTSVHSNNEDAIDNKRNAVVEQLDRTIYKLNQIDNYDENSTFLDEALKVFRLQRKFYDIDYSEALELRKKRTASFEAMQNYFNTVDRLEATVREALLETIEAQKSFAELHDFELVESDRDVAAEMEAINEAFEYVHNVFLIYFKTAKANSYFLDAFEAGDLKDMKKYQAELEEISKTSLEEIKSTEKFKKNIEYKNATAKLVKFYTTASKSYYLKMIAIFEEYEKTDEFSEKAVKDLNKIINQYNKNYEDLYTKFRDAEKELLKESIKENT